MQAMHTAFGSGGDGSLLKTQESIPQTLMQVFHTLHAQVLKN
jgi:hypothetical protein